MNLNKPNDIFVTKSLTPDATVNDLVHSDMVSDNTSFFDRDYYKDTDFAKEVYKNEDGSFDEVRFNEAYDSAAKLYGEISDDEFIKNNIEWDAFDITKPKDGRSKSRDIKIEDDINPFKNEYGRSSLDSVDMGELSVRELAQKSKIWDTAKGEFREESANDLGLFGSWFDDTLVYAQWDEDGQHLNNSTGRMVSHQAGEYKLNDENEFYIETLDGRDVSGKQVVNPTDLITAEGSMMNKVDFFDSDGRDKSVIGTTFKLATELAPMLIPGFNTYYGGFKMAKGLASVLPTFYKSFEGILLGDTTVGNETDLWKAATKAQGFMAKYNQTSFSDNSQDSLWNYEQLGDMVVTTLSQVYEQRAAAKLSNLFYKTNTNPEYLKKLAKISEKELTKSALSGSIRSKATADKIAATAAGKIGEIAKIGEAQSKLAKGLSLGYMAMTSSSEMYQEALNSGYDRRTAGLTSLLAAGGMYGLMMNNRMGDWFLDKTTGYTVEGSRAAVRKGVDQFLPQIEKAVKAIDVNKTVGKKGLANVITNFKKSVNDIFVNSNTTEGIWKNSIVESVEELSEEVLMDATRGIVDTMGWLGMTSKRGNFNTIEKMFSTDGLSNYLTAMFGGAIGGGIFEINRLKIEPFLSGKALEPETQHSLLRLVANGKSEELKSEIDKRVKAMGNSKLAPVLSTTEDGKDEYLFDENSSQALIIAESSKKYIDHLDDIMNAENLKNTDEDIIKKAILNEIKIADLEELGGENNIHGFILSDYNEITDKILETRAKISELETNKEEDDKDTNSERVNKKSETTPEIEKPGQTYTELNEELKKYRDEIKSIMKGEKADYYKQLGIFSLNRNLHKPFISLNIADFTNKKYGKNFYELPDSVGTLTKDSVQSEFDDYLDSEGNFKTKMKFMFDAFDEVNKKFSNSIGEYAEEKHSALRDKYINVLTNSEILPQEKVEIIQEELKKSGLPVYGLDESYNYELGTVLIENGHIDTNNLEEGDINKLKQSLNSIQLPYQDLNPEFLSRGFEAEKKANLDEIQKKINAEIESGVEPSEANAKYLDEIIQITKMTPVFKRPSSSEVIPIELDFINSQIDSDSDIPAEVAEVVKRRVDSKLNKLKESVKNSIVFDAEDYEEVSKDEYDEAIQSDVDMTEIKNKVDSAETFDDVFKIVKELESYVNNLKGDDLKLDYTNQLSTIDVDGIDQIYLDSEKKINSKNSIDNKLLQLLAEMQVELFSVNGVNKTNVLNILGDELDAFKMSDTPQEYTRSKDIVDSMKKSLETIDMALSINDAMLSTEIDQTNPYGFNVSMQNMSNKAKDRNEEENASQELKDSVSPASSYKTIDSKEHTLLSKELNKVAEKLNFLIQLSESNQSTIATAQEEIRSNSQELLLQQLTKEDSPISIINMIIDGEKLVDQETLNNILADSEKSQERKLYDVEELLYKSFKKYYEKSPDSALEQVFSAFNNDDFKKDIKNYTDEGFTRNMSNINTLDYFNYLHALFASDSKKFYNSYKNLLENEVSLDSDKKAPFFGQEFSIRQTYAYRTNKRIMAHSMDFIEKLLGSGQIFLKNSLIVPGSAGTGKTNVVSNFAWRLDPTKDTKVIVSAPSNDVLEKLKQDISKGKESDVDSFSKQELFKKLLGENYDSFYEAIESLENRSKEGDNFSDNFIKDTNNQNVFTINDISKYHVDIVEDFLNKLTNDFSKDHDTVIYIDEVSWMNPFELSIIDHISSMEGSRLYLIGLGDELQNGYSLNDETPFSLDTFYYNHPPKMKSVIRTANVHKQSNVESLEIALKNRMSNLTNPKKFGIQPITLNYFESDNIIEGDKAVDTLQVSDVKKFKGSGEVVAITDDGSLTSEQQAIFNEAGLPDVKVIAKDNVQGKEFDQVISLYKIPYVDDKVSLYNANKQLYTLLSRGKKNTLVVGNNELLSKLQIEPEKKDTTSKIELMMGQIDALLEKRIEFLNQLDEYVEEEVEESEEVIIDEDSETDGEAIIKEEEEANLHENNEPIIENDDSDNKPEEIIKMTQEDYDGNQVFMAYSFYNMLNAKVGSDGELIVNPETDNVLSDMQFLSQVSNAVKKDKSKEDLINDFIIAKNHLLHGLPIPVDKNNVFKNVLSMFSDDSKLVVRKITQSEFTLPYAKNAHMKDDNGNDRSPNIGDPALFLALKTTFTDKNGDEKTGYVTIAGLPDLNNENWKQVKNKEFLQTISNQLEDQQDVEIDAELNPLTGIRTIFEDGTSKAPKENNISITGNTLDEFTKNLNKIMPGLIVPNMNSLDVFDNNEQNIKDEFAKTGYKLAENKEPIENVKGFRFRPYIKVSYINPKDDSYSKLMVFQAKKRSLIEAKKEYNELQDEYELIRDNKIEAEKYIKNKFPSLISRWNGIVLLSDVLSFFEQDQIVNPETGTMESKSDEIMNRLLEMEVEYSEGDSELGIVNAFKDMLKVIKDSDYDVSKLSNDDKRKLLGRIKGGSTLSNLGLRLFDVMSLDEITDFAESQDSEYEVYYNPLWQSKNDESHTAKLDGEDFIKHLELNAYLEPPVFTLKINNIVETESEGEMENEPEINEVEDDLDEIPLIERKTFTTPFIRNNKPLEVEIDLSKWEGNEEQLNMALNSVDGGLKTIKDNLSSLDSNMISIEEAIELVGENTHLLEGLSNGEEVDLNNILINMIASTINPVLSNTVMFDTNNNLVAGGLLNIYKGMIENNNDIADLYDTIDEHIEDGGDFTIDDFFLLSGMTMKAPTTIDNELNKKLCK